MRETEINFYLSLSLVPTVQSPNLDSYVFVTCASFRVAGSAWSFAPCLPPSCFQNSRWWTCPRARSTSESLHSPTRQRKDSTSYSCIMIKIYKIVQTLWIGNLPPHKKLKLNIFLDQLNLVRGNLYSLISSPFHVFNTYSYYYCALECLTGFHKNL